MVALQPRSHLPSSLFRTSSTNGTFTQISPLQDSITEINKNNFPHTAQAIKQTKTRLEMQEAHGRLISQQRLVVALFLIEPALNRV